jgi:hypothetical protein
VVEVGWIGAKGSVKATFQIKAGKDERGRSDPCSGEPHALRSVASPRSQARGEGISLARLALACNIMQSKIIDLTCAITPRNGEQHHA